MTQEQVKPLVHTHITIACDFAINVSDAFSQDEHGEKQRPILQALIKDKKSLLKMLLHRIVEELGERADWIEWDEWLLNGETEKAILTPVLQKLGMSNYPILEGDYDPKYEGWFLEDLQDCLKVSWDDTRVFQSLVPDDGKGE